MTRTMNARTHTAQIHNLDALTSSQIALAGGKAVNLAEMLRAGLPVPPGFVVSTEAYRAVIAEQNLDASIQEILSTTAADNSEELEHAATRIQALFQAVTIPAELTSAITDAYRSLGANVSGEVNPDQWVIEKSSGRVVETTIARKEQMTTRTRDGIAHSAVPVEPREKPSLCADEISQLHALGRTAEQHFGEPQDIEWAIEAGTVFLVQSRPITSLYPVPATEPGKPGVRIVRTPEEGRALQSGEILVTTGTNPAWTPLFLKIGALIMECGGPISHGSVVAREYGVPAVSGVAGATDVLRDGQLVRLNGENGTIELLRN